MTAGPVVVPIAGLALVAMLLVLRRRRALSPPRAAVAAVACAYGAGVLANTIFPIYLDARRAVSQSWTTYLNLTPGANTDLRDMVTNLVAFVPLGVLLPLLFRVRSVVGVVAIGFVLSLAMELVQLLNAVTGHDGHVADVNDLVANTIGTPVGYGVLGLARQVPIVARVADAAAWPRSGRRNEPAEV